MNGRKRDEVTLHSMFRDLPPADVAGFEKWAEENYTPGAEISDLWHPAVKRRCAAMNRRAGTDPVDAAIAALEPLVARSQLKRALEHARAHFERQMELGGPQAGRAVLEKLYLVCGDRRKKALNVECDRRGS